MTRASVLITYVGLLTLGLGAVGCTNLQNSTKRSKTKGTAPAPNDPSSVLEEAFQIASAIPNARNPGELIIQGSDETFGTYCAGSGTGGENPTTPCVCVYDYNSGGTAQQVEKNTSYVENELMRCEMADIPSTATGAQVHVKIMETKQTSNLISLTDETLSQLKSFDPTEIKNFAEIKRYQCREHIFIPNMFDSKVYDPIQSENLDLIYPLNFYTDSTFKVAQAFRGAFGAVDSGAAGGGDARDNWECSFNPSDSWTNFIIYARDPSNGFISEVNGNRTARTTFLLSRKRGGVFSVPVNAYVAPLTLSKFLSGATDVAYDPLVDDYASSIGYAAKAISTSTGERCPTAAESEIPDGYKWVKIWAFKGDLAPRKYVANSVGIQQTGEIACNPGDYGGAKAWSTTYNDGSSNVTTSRVHQSVYSDCVFQETNGNYRNAYPLDEPLVWSDRLGLSNSYGDFFISARIFGSNLCVIPGAQDNDSCPSNSSCKLDRNDTNSLGNGGVLFGGSKSSEVVSGSDFYGRVARIQTSDGTAIGNSLTAQLFENYRGGSMTSPTFLPWTNISLPIQAQATIPMDLETNLAIKPLDNAQSRADWIFIATPPEVSRNSMINQIGADLYIPFTYHNRFHCQTGTPSNPSYPNPPLQGTCPDSQKVTYALHSSEVGADSGSGTDHTFPVCALQPEGL